MTCNGGPEKVLQIILERLPESSLNVSLSEQKLTVLRSFLSNLLKRGYVFSQELRVNGYANSDRLIKSLVSTFSAFCQMIQIERKLRRINIICIHNISTVLQALVGELDSKMDEITMLQLKLSEAERLNQQHVDCIKSQTSNLSYNEWVMKLKRCAWSLANEDTKVLKTTQFDPNKFSLTLESNLVSEFVCDFIFPEDFPKDFLEKIRNGEDILPAILHRMAWDKANRSTYMNYRDTICRALHFIMIF